MKISFFRKTNTYGYYFISVVLVSVFANVIMQLA